MSIAQVGDTIHRMTGRLGQEPIGGIPWVAALPDDYMPAPQDKGWQGFNINAGGAGKRSELFLFNLGPADGVEITDIMVALSTAGGLFVGWLAASAMPAAAPDRYYASDLRSGYASLGSDNQNTAGATAGARTVVNYLPIGTAPVLLPNFGIILPPLARNPVAGTAGSGWGLVIRPAADNVTLSIGVSSRVLEKRSL